jgi:outer membrane protein assembly factor BamB
MIRRRAFLRLGAAGVVASLASPVAAVEPVWVDPREIDSFELFGDEVLTVGSHLRTIDPTTGQERRSARLRKPSGAEGPATLTVSASAIVFGWYVWHEAVYIVSADPKSLQVRWQRRMNVTEEERGGGVPMVVPLVRSDGVFVLIAHKHSENLFRLRPENGEIVWSRYIERFAVEAPLAWHTNRLLVRSRVARGAQASGDLHAIDPSTGATLWRIRLEGHDVAGFDTALIVGQRGYIVAPLYPGESCRLHIVDLVGGMLTKSLTIDRLGEPFAYHDGIVYFGGRMPTAWDATSERVIWRADLRERRGKIIYISHEPVLDIARRRIYLGESEHSFFVLSSSDGAVLNRVDVRRGRTRANIMTVYGAFRLRLMRDLLLVGAGDQHLLAFSTASL